MAQVLGIGVQLDFILCDDIGMEPPGKCKSSLCTSASIVPPSLTMLWGRWCDVKETQDLEQFWVLKVTPLGSALQSHCWIEMMDHFLIVLLPFPSPLNLSYSNYLFSAVSFFFALKPKTSHWQPKADVLTATHGWVFRGFLSHSPS